MKDGILQYLVEMASPRAGKSDQLDGISRFVADYPDEAVPKQQEDSLRVNGVTNRTRRLVTEAYQVGSEVHRRNVMMIHDYHEQVVGRWRRASLLIGLVLCLLMFGSGYLFGSLFSRPTTVEEPASPPVPAASLARAKKDQMDRIRLEGKLQLVRP